MTASLTKILHVEDEPDIQEVAKLALEAVGGFTVETCSSGQEALEKASIFMPDLILLDVMMPGMDGPETMRALRELPGFDTTPVVFMTAKVMGAEVQRFKEMGALDVISKPFDPMTLTDDIKRIWDARNG
jgi:two-component system, OmpR family, response regulator